MTSRNYITQALAKQPLAHRFLDYLRFNEPFSDSFCIPITLKTDFYTQHTHIDVT